MTAATKHKNSIKGLSGLRGNTLRRMIDNVSDSYVVINDKYEIIDFNKTLSDLFKDVIDVKRIGSILDLLNSNKEVFSASDTFVEYNERAIKSKATVTYEKLLAFGNTQKYLTIELTPIFTEGSYFGTIVLLKDITKVKKNLISVQEKHKELGRLERLSSLGQLIGGVAHNFKTPIMSISGSVKAVKELAEEYLDSLDDPEVNVEDYLEIVAEIEKWTDIIEPNCRYMKEVIEAVREQALNINFKSEELFSVKEAVIKAVDLIRPVVKQRKCTITSSVEIDEGIRIKGDINGLVQVINNLIENASEAYKEEGGPIEVKAEIVKEMAVISVSDKGCGIEGDLHKKLFKQMVTTKGKKGTGIGLLISYSTIKGMFNGYIWFETLLNQGTRFYISVPYVNVTRGGTGQDE